MVANAKSVHLRNEIMDLNVNNPKRLWKSLKQTAPIKPTLSSLSYVEMCGQQVTDPLSMANAFHDHFTNIRLSVNLLDQWRRKSYSQGVLGNTGIGALSFRGQEILSNYFQGTRLDCWDQGHTNLLSIMISSTMSRR